VEELEAARGGGVGPGDVFEGAEGDGGGGRVFGVVDELVEEREGAGVGGGVLLDEMLEVEGGVGAGVGAGGGEGGLDVGEGGEAGHVTALGYGVTAAGLGRR
jgi:hypothetical protein